MKKEKIKWTWFEKLAFVCLLLLPNLFTSASTQFLSFVAPSILMSWAIPLNPLVNVLVGVLFLGGNISYIPIVYPFGNVGFDSGVFFPQEYVLGICIVQAIAVLLFFLFRRGKKWIPILSTVANILSIAVCYAAIPLSIMILLKGGTTVLGWIYILAYLFACASLPLLWILERKKEFIPA